MNLPQPRPLGKRHGRLSQGARKGKMSGSERINARSREDTEEKSLHFLPCRPKFPRMKNLPHFRTNPASFFSPLRAFAPSRETQ